MKTSAWETKLTAYLKGQGLRLTEQRRTIVQAFFDAPGHVDIDTLYQLVKSCDSRIGQATVYRTLKLLTESGLAHTSRFGGTATRYEPSDDEHHDHLVCKACDLIVEFCNDQIEALQEQVAEEHGFKLKTHKMELYGLCPECQAKQ
jgi:Fur family transcriptional regulator, ferric uptake regulator